MGARMLALLTLSIGCFLALFFALLALVRHAATNGTQQVPLPRATPSTTTPHLLSNAQSSSTHTPTLRAKHPDWRFLVRDGRRPFPSGQTSAPRRKPPLPVHPARTRSDWTHFNKDFGHLNDPYQAPQSTARQA